MAGIFAIGRALFARNPQLWTSGLVSRAAAYRIPRSQFRIKLMN
jgi:hypothetical protein